MMNGQEETPAPEYEEKKSGLNWTTILIIGGIILIVSIVAIYLFMFKFKKEKEF